MNLTVAGVVWVDSYIFSIAASHLLEPMSVAIIIVHNNNNNNNSSHIGMRSSEEV